jgi:uncharacterized protein
MSTAEHGGTRTVSRRKGREMAKFEIYKRKDGEYSWRMRSGNGQIIATAGEGFDTKAGAQNGVAAVQRDAAGAKVEETD